MCVCVCATGPGPALIPGVTISHDSARSREDARRPDGRFGHQYMPEPDGSLTGAARVRPEFADPRAHAIVYSTLWGDIQQAYAAAGADHAFTPAETAIEAWIACVDMADRYPEARFVGFVPALDYPARDCRFGAVAFDSNHRQITWTGPGTEPAGTYRLSTDLPAEMMADPSDVQAVSSESVDAIPEMTMDVSKVASFDISTHIRNHTLPGTKARRRDRAVVAVARTDAGDVVALTRDGTEVPGYGCPDCGNMYATKAGLNAHPCDG